MKPVNWIADRRSAIALAGLTIGMLLAAVGCGRTSSPPPDPGELRQAAIAVLADVLENTPRPMADSTVPQATGRNALLAQYQLQAQAMEVLGEFPAIVQSQWVVRGLDSPSDGVRYSTLLAIGKIADYQGGRLAKPYLGRVRELIDNPNDFLKVASAYALYKLTGDPEAIGALPGFLTDRGSSGEEGQALAKLRAETAFVLSLMPQLKPQPLLQLALTDPDESVQLMAQSRLAVLGDAKAINQVINAAQSPHADDQLDALTALGESPNDDLAPIKLCLNAAKQAEVRMAAARALGLHGDKSGQKLALKWLNYRDPERLTPQDAQRDPLHDFRVRFLAALALGGIGDYDASAGPLREVLVTSPSRRFQMTAARAALELLTRSGRWDEGRAALRQPPPGR